MPNRFARAGAALVVALIVSMQGLPAGVAQDEPFGGSPPGIVEPPDPFGAPAGDDPFGAPVGDDPFGGGEEPPPEPERVEPQRAPREGPVTTRFAGGDAEVLKALDQRLDFEFRETPLADVADYIRTAAKMQVELDEQALEEVGVGLDTPINFHAKQLPLASALRLMLRQVDLMHDIRDGALLITTPDELDSRLLTRVYAVGPLVKSDDELFVDDPERSLDNLIDVVSAAVRPTTWDEVGGPGSIRGFRRMLIVMQTREVHDEVADMLADLAKGARMADAGGEPPVAFLPQPADGASDDEAKIFKALDRPAELSVIETPLRDVIEMLADKTGIAMQFDQRAMEEVGIGDDTPVTRNSKGVSLRTVLRLLLDEMDLTYVVRDDVLLITTHETCECELVTRIYPVADLVRPGEPDESLDVNAEAEGFDALDDAITAAIRPTTWEAVGGPGAIGECCGCLVIAQTSDVHDEIVPLVLGLRKLHAQAKASPDEPGEVVALDEMSNSALAKLRARMQEEVGMIALTRLPLFDAVKLLSEKTGVPMELDHRAFEEYGIGVDMEVSAMLGGESLGSALRRILRPYGLTWVLRDDLVWVTTPEEAEGQLETRLYPVGDLVARKRLDEHSSGYDDLIETITSTITPSTWEAVGGPAAIVEFPRSRALIVSHTTEGHDQLGALLAEIRVKHVDDDGDAPDDAQPAPLTNKAGERLHLKVYKLRSPKPTDAHAIAAMIGEFVEPASWMSGEPHYLESVTGAVIIRHTAKTHRKIYQLLVELDALAGVGGQGISGGHGGAPLRHEAEAASGEEVLQDNGLGGAEFGRGTGFGEEASATPIVED